MMSRTRHPRLLLAPSLGLMISLAGCTGSSEDKGDNGGSIITPPPGKVQDANTAGSSKSALPEPAKVPDSKAADATDPAPK